MRLAQFFCTAVLCGVLVTPAVAADKAKSKAAQPSVDVKKIHDVLENETALNSFLGKPFRAIRSLTAKDADAAEKLINAFEAEIKKAKPKNPKSVALIPRATRAISFYRDQVAPRAGEVAARPLPGPGLCRLEAPPGHRCQPAVGSRGLRRAGRDRSCTLA